MCDSLFLVCPLKFFYLKSKKGRLTLIYLLCTTVKYSSYSVFFIRGQFSDNSWVFLYV